MSSPIVISRDGETNGNSRNKFQDYRFEKIQIPDLLRLIRWHGASSAELLPLIEVLNRQPIGAFENLRDLHANCHGRDSERSSACIEVMRDLLLESVDQRLQNLYRKHFRTRPPKSDATHEQKIATLEATRDDVRLILNSYNWRWFANWLEL